MNSMAMCTKHFAILTSDPRSGAGKAQISNLALGPAVNTGSLPAAFVTNWLKSLVGLGLDMSFRSLRTDRLIDNFYSTKRKICCYTDYGHRRPPLDKVYLGRQTYIPGNTGCPFYLILQHFSCLCFN